MSRGEQVQFIEGEPPQARPSRRPKGARQLFVEQLRANRGRWAIYARVPGRGAPPARQMAYEFKKRFVGVDARSVTVGEETVCYVVAR